MITALIAATAIADPWTLNAPFKGDWKTEYATTVNIREQQEEISVEMNIKWQTDKKDQNAQSVIVSWSGITVNGNPMDQDSSWTASISPTGSIKKIVGAEDDYRRMLMPFAFIYPEKPVNVGDSWTSAGSVEGISETDWTFEAKVEKNEMTQGRDTLRVATKLKEKSAGALEVNGNWWIAKDGTVVKFNLDLKNWLVPLADGQTFSAIVSGKLK